MNWLRTEVVGLGKIIVISDQHLAIRNVFKQPNLGWCEVAEEIIHRLCSHYIAQNVYKYYPNKRVSSYQEDCKT
jgi:hypothetical protein